MPTEYWQFWLMVATGFIAFVWMIGFFITLGAMWPASFFRGVTLFFAWPFIMGKKIRGE